LVILSSGALPVAAVTNQGSCQRAGTPARRHRAHRGPIADGGGV